MKIYIYREDNGKWYWQAVSKSGRILAISETGYSRKSSAKEAATLFRYNIYTADFYVLDSNGTPVNILDGLGDN